MSSNNSGASTPRSGATPPPSEGPSPLTVGTRFVKQYYKVLSTTPQEIFRFYQPSSFLSHGVGSQPTHPIVFENKESIQMLKDRFYIAQQDGYENCPIRFEFEHGAIDAQLSVNGGVLLVVTGHIVYLNSEDDDDEEEEEEEEVASVRRKAFVHTFFLGSIMSGAMRSYYVHNDVLRFLQDDEEKTVVVSNKSAEEPKTPVRPKEVPPVEVLAKEEDVVFDDDEAPGGGVEETKEALLEEDVKEAETPNVLEETPAKEQAAVESPKPAAPGSWASLVARSGGTTTPTAGTPVRPTKPSTPSSTTSKPKASSPAAAATPEGGSSARQRPGKRDPDCTLVIKNISDDTTEADILGLFEPFAGKTDAKVVSTTVSAHKAIAFVDYNSPAPVLAAVKQHEKAPFKLHDQVLEIYQKTVEQRSRRSSSGSGRNYHRASSNGSSYRGSGGRQQYRRGGGQRGGRGSSRGASGGGR